MISSIVLPLDGSTLSARAVPFAVYLARRTRADVVLLRAHDNVNPALVHNAEALVLAVEHERAEQRAAARDLHDLAETARAQGIVAHVSLVGGDPAVAILDAARTRAGCLIVMATRAAGGPDRWLYGSVADAVLRQATAPMLLIPAGCDQPWSDSRALRVLVPLDGSELAEVILRPLGVLAGAVPLEVHLLRVIPSGARDVSCDRGTARSYLRTVRTRLGFAGSDAATHVVVGDPAESIDAATREHGIDLIAMTTHGRGGLARLVLGSVAEQTLRRVCVPLLLVRAFVHRIARPTDRSSVHSDPGAA